VPVFPEKAMTGTIGPVSTDLTPLTGYARFGN
jgi:hypothetical protein